jgi:rod shape-determining protein MreB
MLDGLDILLKKELKVPVFIAESPLTCVAEGTGKMLENLHLIDE